MTAGNFSPAIPRIFKASRLLQAKAGHGPVDEKTLERCQAVLDLHSQSADFPAMAASPMAGIEAALLAGRDPDACPAAALQALIPPVMEIKANAPTFQYALTGRLAGALLGFLETTAALDALILEVAEAHVRAIRALVSWKMAGEGGKMGAQMEEELENARARYFQKIGVSASPA